ncbi:MAG: dinuclear metal center YbgI/SA1388 family protein [Sphingobacteriales bacterium]|jgi:dinuclear metal center YbgI/SA1388 family protein
MTQIKQVISFLEKWAPPSLQESYDNSRLIVGDDFKEVTNVLVSLDCTEEIIDEALAKGANLVVCHHPIVFKGLKSFTGKTYVERTVIKAIQNNVAIYAIHTNLDSVLDGVSGKIAEKLGLENVKILRSSPGKLKKIVVFSPESCANEVRSAMFEAGAGAIGDYEECSFNSKGDGTFKAGVLADPFVGNIGESHIEPEIKIESVCPDFLVGRVIEAAVKKHAYEEVAYDVFSTDNVHSKYGLGVVGDLKTPLAGEDFLRMTKKSLATECVRHTQIPSKKIEKVAVCGGAGGFLLDDAKAAGADVLVTADFKYHEFFDARDSVMIADVGHFESEQFTIDLLHDRISEKFSNFAVLKTEVNTNPINYF